MKEVPSGRLAGPRWRRFTAEIDQAMRFGRWTILEYGRVCGRWVERGPDLDVLAAEALRPSPPQRRALVDEAAKQGMVRTTGARRSTIYRLGAKVTKKKAK